MKIFLLTSLLVFGVMLCAAEYILDPKDLDVGTWKITPWKAATEGTLLVGNKTGSVAQGAFELPAAGKYYVWFRDYSFCGKFRRTKVSLNHNEIGIFGDASDEEKVPRWMWTRAKDPVELPAGKIDVSFTALNPYSRCDALLLSTDEKFVPHNKAEDAAKLQVVK